MQDARNLGGAALSAPDIQRKHRRATRCMWASCFALVVSLLAVVVSSTAWSPLVPYLLWNHLLVIGLCAWAGFAIRRLPQRPAGARAVPRPRELLAPWVLALGLVALVGAAARWAPPVWDMGTTPEGQAITSRQYYTSDGGNRYFERLNHGTEREITEAEYQEGERGVWQMFARVWTVFSFIALLMWRFVALRWQAEPSSSEESSPLAQTGAPPAVVMRPASSKVSVAVAGLWALAIGSSLSGFASPLPSMICSAPIGADKSFWFVLLLPPVMFPAGNWFMRAARAGWGAGCESPRRCRSRGTALSPACVLAARAVEVGAHRRRLCGPSARANGHKLTS